MILDSVFLWRELLDRDLSNTVVVIADVLRATTTMIRALENGAKGIVPQPDEAAARDAYAARRDEGVPVLLCGEKEGMKRPGYDLGNSPFEFTADVVSGQTIIHLTTNGTRALRAAETAKETIIASFANMQAVSALLKAKKGTADTILFVVSGKEGHYCLEDTVCLGGILTELIDPPGQGYHVTDAARTAVDLYTLYQDRLLDMIHQCNHGRYLEEVGLGKDLPECVRVNTSTIVPHMRNGMITLA